MKKILVVEDEVIIRLDNERIFKMLNYSVISAINGLEAIKCCNKHKFDLILMDIKMPDMNGIDAARKIRKIDSCKNIPIIFLSGNLMKKEILKIPGRNLLINKPINIKKLINILEEI